MSSVKLLNAYKGRVVRPIKAQYNNTSYANLIRTDSFGATGVIQMKVKNQTKAGYIECPIGGGQWTWLSLTASTGEAE